jgi:hypothetical protein
MFFRPVQRGGAYRLGLSFASFHHHRFASRRFDSFQSFKIEFEILKLWKKTFKGTLGTLLNVCTSLQLTFLIRKVLFK